jgi:hypothetical protein
MVKPREGGPTVENRWWVDTDKGSDQSKAIPKGERPPVGSRFFDIGYEFDQEQAKQRLTDLNLKFLDEGRPEPNSWRLIRMVPNECVPAGQIERMKQRLPLPPGARGVIVDSGRSVRFIITGDPIGERVLEFTLGEESSFDCWIRGDWVREELFRDLDDALRKARPFVGRYLGPEPQADNDTRA